MSVDLWVFNVGRGLCVAIRSPNGYLCVMDCGRSDDFSAIEWLASQEWTKHKGYKLSKLIITHPHVDHIADVENVTRNLQPFMILRRKKNDLNWEKVIGGGSDETAAMKHYVDTYMPPKYNLTIEDKDKPDWGNGFTLHCYCLDENDAENISGTDSAYVNNTSYVTILKYKRYCFALSGDIESDAMAALLGDSRSLCTAIGSGVDFYLTPHHGHESGFSNEWFNTAGATRIFNIASERRKGRGEDDSKTKADARYSQDDCCKGNNREGRKLVSTKEDGHIHIWISDDGKWGWKGVK